MSEQILRLYGFGESGNAYKVALMLALTGTPHEIVPVDFFNGETRTVAYRETVNEMGEVPVLVDGDLRLTQSGAILDYLAERTGQFGARDARERAEVLRWMFFDNHKFTATYASLRFMVGIMGMPESPVTEYLRARTRGAFDIVDKHMATRLFVAAERPTIADLSMVGYLFYTEKTGLDLTDWPNIIAWRERIAALPGWRAPYDLMAPATKKRT